MAHCRIVIVGAALAAIASHFIAPPIAAKAAPTKVASPAIGAAWHLIIPPQFESHPNEADEFVKATGVDALAIAIGTSHGAYKFRFS